jgi:ATP-binding cassette, subfamily C, type I secretion system permease/ATPase
MTRRGFWYYAVLRALNSGQQLAPRERDGLSGLKAANAAYTVCRRGVWIVGLFSLFMSALLLTSPLYMLQVYDRVLGSGSIETLIMLSLVAMGALALLSLLDSVRHSILSRIGLELETSLGGPLLTASIEAAARGRDLDVQGLRDLAQLRGFVSSPAVTTVFELPLTPLFICVLCLIHPLLGTVTLIGAALLLFFAFLNQRMTASALAQTSKHSLAALASAQAYVRNAELVHAMGLYPDAISNWGKHNALALAGQIEAADRISRISSLSRFTRLVLQIAMLGFGALLVLKHEMTGGMIVAASIIGGRALAPIDGVIASWKSLLQAHQANERIKTLLGTTAELVDKVTLPRPQGWLSFEGVHYVPTPNNPPVLKALTFRIRPGEAIGIVGPAGAGKSTLARLAIGAIAPSAGVVRLDGVDVNQWTRDEFGTYVGYLQQYPEFFPGTVAQNIAWMRPDAPAEAIVASSQLSGAYDVIVRLPKGFDTLLGPGGVTLSGGQRQRIGLARAFYGDPSLIILDEPNANLDSEGDEALSQAIRVAKSRGITVMVIAQRPRAIQLVDRIMVLQDGVITQFGLRDEVLPRILGPGPVAPAAPAQKPQSALQQVSTALCGSQVVSIVPGRKPAS